MKTILSVVVAGLVLVLFSMPIQAVADSHGTGYISGDFTAKDWKETIVDGQEGNPGNTLSAKGKHFEFKGAVLQNVGMSPDQDYDYETIYADGGMALKKGGPWGKDLCAEGIEAVNLSKKYVDEDCEVCEEGEECDPCEENLTFMLTFTTEMIEGKLKKAKDKETGLVSYYCEPKKHKIKKNDEGETEAMVYTADVVATYDDVPKYKFKKDVLQWQKGKGFFVGITISENSENSE